MPDPTAPTDVRVHPLVLDGDGFPSAAVRLVLDGTAFDFDARFAVQVGEWFQQASAIAIEQAEEIARRN